MRYFSRRSHFICALYLVGIFFIICLHFGFFLQFNVTKINKYFSPAYPHFNAQEPTLNSNQFQEWIAFIKKATPLDSLIVIPDLDRHKQYSVTRRIGSVEICDYFLFPRQTAYLDEDKAALFLGPVYAVRVQNTYGYAGPVLKRYDLNQEFSLSLIRDRRNNESSLLSAAKAAPAQRSSGLPVVFKLVLLSLSGVFIVLFEKRQRRVELFSDSFLAGVTVFSVFYIVASFLGLLITPAWEAGFFICAISLGLIMFARFKENIIRVPAVDNKYFLFGGVVVLFFAAMFVISLQVPLGRWDYWAIWGLKARAIEVFNSLEGLKYWGRKIFYPPLVPLLFGVIAGLNAVAIKLVTMLFVIILYFIIQREIAKTTESIIIKLIVPLLLFTTNVFAEHSMWGYANIVLAVFVSRAVFLAGDLMRGSVSKGWLLLAVLLCGAALARPEGILYCLLLTGLIFVGYIKKNVSFGSLWPLLLPYLIFGIWCGYVFYILANGHITYRKMDIPEVGFGGGYSYYISSAAVFLKHMLSYTRWGLIPVLFILLLAWQPKRLLRDRFIELCFVVISSLGLLLFSFYVADKWGGPEFYSDTGLVRYFMTLVPIMFVVAFEQLMSISRHCLNR